jgi:RNA polymerase sigma-70 factor (ECF subfamily)
MTEDQQLVVFDEWVDKHRGLLFKVIRVYATDHNVQQDLFQEIVVQLWRSIPAFRAECAVSTWIYRIALNTSIKWMGKERRFYANRQSLDHVHLVQQETPGDDRLTWLYEQIVSLDEIDRSIALLLLDGFTYKEMATILGITESHVGVKINRIKKYLISRIDKP